MVENVKVAALNRENVLDQLKVCWGHLDNWRNLKIVQKSREWLEKANGFFAPTTFIVYKNAVPVGMIEFLPYRLLNKIGLCPCRVDAKNKETAGRYILEGKFENYLFISCLVVSKDHQRKEVGKTLLNHFLHSEALKDFDGALVYVTKRDQSWDKHIHWPAGPKEFYLKVGFVIEKALGYPTGYLLRSINHTG